jgi:L-histidine Nalpha-methyltransferase
VPFIPAVSELPEAAQEMIVASNPTEAIAAEVRAGLTSNPKTLSPWLFYDETGSRLFEQITQLPEYYLTRTERAIFHAHADEIIAEASRPTGNDPAPILTLIELGAGTATKTGILLAAAVRRQSSVVYQPVDVSITALEAATENIRANVPGVVVRCQVADYTTQALPLNRLPDTRTLALYIGSSIGNFSPDDARDVLRNLRAQLLPGDTLLLGTDLAPRRVASSSSGSSSSDPSSSKDEATLLAAYNDAAGVTAAFNRNILARLNRELGANFNLNRFMHRAIWNSEESRIEMHLESLVPQRVHIPENAAGPTLSLDFAAGESIHTENSYKFTPARVERLLTASGFTVSHQWQDPQQFFAVNLATAV